MNIDNLAKDASKLRQIHGCVQNSRKRLLFSSITFHFDEAKYLTLKVDENTDELLWDDGVVIADELEARGDVFSFFKNAEDMFLTWSWSMTNQQGYFDAMQMEFTDKNLSTSYILQFKAAASAIEVFAVKTVIPE